MKTKIVTGVGSRRIDSEGTKRVTNIAKILNFLGYTLRSGAADGADSIFESNMYNKEIYLPVKGFNGKRSGLVTDEYPREAYDLLKEVHPYFSNMKEYTQKLHLRNANQVLGKDLKNPIPSDMLVCWTPDGAYLFEQCQVGVTGGTMTAIRIACLNNIPVYNLKLDSHYNLLVKWFKDYLSSLQDLVEIPKELKEIEYV